MILYYDFNEYWHDGPDSVHVVVKRFPIHVEDNCGMSEEELHEKYRNIALEAAAYKIMEEYAEFAF